MKAVMLLKFIEFTVGNSILGLYEAVTLVTPITLIYTAILCKALLHYYKVCGLANCPEFMPYMIFKHFSQYMFKLMLNSLDKGTKIYPFNFYIFELPFNNLSTYIYSREINAINSNKRYT